jgi:hypothetical protein
MILADSWDVMVRYFSEQCCSIVGVKVVMLLVMEIW